MISDLINKNGAILISSWANIVYLTSYSAFSNTERECFLLYTKNKKYLITDGRYSEAVKHQVKGFEIIDIGAVNFIENDGLKILRKLNSIGVEEEDLRLSEYKSIKKIISKINSIDLSDLRIIKNEPEIINIKKACKIADQAFDKAIKEIKTGITEKEISNKIQRFIKDAEGEISFPPIVAFGKNSAVPHHLSGNTKLKKNQIILLDFGAKVNNYCSDMSRTLFYGKANDKFKKMHSTVLASQKQAIDLLKSKISAHKSVLASEVDAAARIYIQKEGYPEIPHSVGHGIGIEVHELPYISPMRNMDLKPGMVFSIEPGIYDPLFGGVRIEDLVLIRKNDLQLISNARREIIELDYV